MSILKSTCMRFASRPDARRVACAATTAPRPNVHAIVTRQTQGKRSFHGKRTTQSVRCSATPSTGVDTQQKIIAPELPRVSASDVAAKLKSGAPGTIIVDVRDEQEVATGRIRASLNAPSPMFKADDKAELDGVIRSKLQGAQEIIVHCHFSGFRGPTCAKVLDERLKALGIDGPEVKVLAGGVAGFMDAHKEDAELVVLPEGGWAPAHS